MIIIIHLSEWLKQKNNSTTKCWWEWREIDHILLVVHIHEKLSKYLTYDPVISLLVIYSREMKAHVPTKTCIWMFIAVWFAIVPNWDQPRYPSTGKCLNRLRQHPYQGMLLIHKKEEAVYWCTQQLGWILRDYAKWKKLISKGWWSNHGR